MNMVCLVIPNEENPEDMHTNYKVGDFIFKMTCYACPEQYDIFLNEKQVGYIRVRWGYFGLRYPDSNGSYIFETSEISGDGALYDEERPTLLITCAVLLEKKLIEDGVIK